MKTNLAEKVIDKLTEQLGHAPSSSELAKELNGAGLLLLADKITGPTGFEVNEASDD